MKLLPSFIAALSRKTHGTSLHQHSFAALDAPFFAGAMSFVPDISSDVSLGGRGVEAWSFLIADANVETFEAIMDVPSVVAFTLVALAFILHKLLINKVTEATSLRIKASKSLEGIQSLNSTGTEEATLNAATLAYENALAEEERLRTLLPGVRIAGPNDLQSMQQGTGSMSSESTKGFLAVAVMSQIVLLLLLAFYPIVPNEILTRIGNP